MSNITKYSEDTLNLSEIYKEFYWCQWSVIDKIRIWF